MQENDLIFDFSQAISQKKFDDSDHGLSHCMKAVDFVIEEEDRLIFIEVKDPDNPQARQEALADFLSDKLINSILPRKCRDSFIYEYSAGHINKPVFYFVLLARADLSPAEFSTLSDKLRKSLPTDWPKDKNWPNKFVQDCFIFNIDSWNRLLPRFPVVRLSEQDSQ